MSSTPTVIDPNLQTLIQKARWEDAIDKLEDLYYLWYSYAVRFKLTPCRGWCKTAAVDGKHLFFNPEWTATLSDEKVLFVLIHEVFHISGGHLWRGAPYIQAVPKEEQPKVAKRVNRAQDGAIHQILVPLSLGEQKGVIEFPPEGIYSPDYDNMSFEDIYELMLEEEAKKDPEGDSAGGPGDLLDVHITVGSGDAPDGAVDLGDGNWILVTDENGKPIKPEPGGDTPFPGVTKEELQKLAADAVNEAREAASGMGSGAGHGMGSQLRVAEITEHKMNWKDILRQWVMMTAKSDYRFTRPNRRYLARGMMVPGLVSESVTGVVAVDVSGSINRETYNSFMTELEGIRKELPQHDLVVIWCSDGIHKTQRVNQHESIDRNFDGSGGTSFKPVFDYVEANVPNPMFLIYFTDGDNFDRGKYQQPNYPVLWALNGGYIKEHPWGINMRIPKDAK